MSDAGAKPLRGPLELAVAEVPPGALRIAYGADPLQFGELRVPSREGPHPVAIVVHGGCWAARLEHLDERAVALDNMRPLAAALTGAGIATWNIEYRRLGHRGGGWPGTFQDVGRAADFVADLAGAHALDLARVIAIGHSSGGHLAMWLAARAKLPRTSEVAVLQPLALRGVVNLDGPADLKAMFPVQQAVCRRSVVTELMGGSPEEQPARYRLASPVDWLPLGLRQAHLAGAAFAAHVSSYEAAMRRAGEVLQATVVADAGHFEFIDPQSDVWPRVVDAVANLLSAP